MQPTQSLLPFLVGPLFTLLMLKHTLIHPEISEVLARAGHHAKVLLADGNYPA